MDVRELRLLRKEAGLSQGSVAQAAGKSASWLSAVERGGLQADLRDLFKVHLAIRDLVAKKGGL